MQFDQHRNLAIGTIVIGPIPGECGQTFPLTPGEGIRFSPNMPVILRPSDQIITPDNAEIGDLTAVVGDLLTITRAQGDTTARRVGVGWRVIGGMTAKTFTNLEEALDGTVSQAEFDSHVG